LVVVDNQTNYPDSRRVPPVGASGRARLRDCAPSDFLDGYLGLWGWVRTRTVGTHIQRLGKS
jgi:hypothetical protein